MIPLKKPDMQGAEISSKLKELSQSTPFSSYATPQIGFFQRNQTIELGINHD
jgi:hypothetical protein